MMATMSTMPTRTTELTRMTRRLKIRSETMPPTPVPSESTNRGLTKLSQTSNSLNFVPEFDGGSKLSDVETTADGRPKPVISGSFALAKGDDDDIHSSSKKGGLGGGGRRNSGGGADQ